MKIESIKLLYIHRFLYSASASLTTTTLVFALVSKEFSKIQIGYVLASRTVPMLFVLLIGLKFADSINCKTKLFLSLFFMNVYQILMFRTLESDTKSLATLVGLQIIPGIVTAIYFPALTTLIPKLAISSLQRTNSTMRMAINIANILGIALGGIAIDRIGAIKSFQLSELMLLASTLLMVIILLSRNLGTVFTESTLQESEPHLNKIKKEITGFLKENRWLVMTLVYASILNAAVSGILGVLAPTIASEILGGTAWGIFNISIAIGMIIGSSVAGKIQMERTISVPILLTLIHAALFTNFAFFLNIWSLIGLGFLCGIAIEIFGVFWDTNLQTNVPPKILGRVSTLDAFFSFSAVPAGQIIAGGLADSFGNRGTILLFSLIVVVSAIYVSSKDEIHKFESHKKGGSHERNSQRY